MSLLCCFFRFIFYTIRFCISIYIYLFFLYFGVSLIYNVYIHIVLNSYFTSINPRNYSKLKRRGIREKTTTTISSQESSTRFVSEHTDLRRNAHTKFLFYSNILCVFSLPSFVFSFLGGTHTHTQTLTVARAHLHMGSIAFACFHCVFWYLYFRF